MPAELDGSLGQRLRAFPCDSHGASALRKYELVEHPANVIVQDAEQKLPSSWQLGVQSAETVIMLLQETEQLPVQLLIVCADARHLHSSGAGADGMAGMWAESNTVKAMANLFTFFTSPATGSKGSLAVSLVVEWLASTAQRHFSLCQLIARDYLLAHVSILGPLEPSFKALLINNLRSGTPIGQGLVPDANLVLRPC